ncbi:twin-arginine translocase subunit TatC [Enterococcus camelliae]|uniref:Sec-independent protein translocase protein TatC n=1 Tax=Enterococcus camelliae TaxID=453959 RepID=A0ABW5TJ88_9ENTE
MTLLEHLIELRRRLILVGFFFFGFFFIACIWIVPWVLALQERQLPATFHFYTIRISEGLEVYLNLAALLALLFTLPLLFWQLWAYIKPGLYEQEKKIGQFYFPLVLTMFLTGGIFAYFFIFPIIVNSLIRFSTSLGFNVLVTFSDYLQLLTQVLLWFGILFQYPLVIIFLARIGLVGADQLKKKRKYAYFTILVIAGLISPPEVMSHLAMTVPLILLYEISLLFIVRLEKRTAPNE